MTPECRLLGSFFGKWHDRGEKSKFLLHIQFASLHETFTHVQVGLMSRVGQENDGCRGYQWCQIFRKVQGGSRKSSACLHVQLVDKFERDAEVPLEEQNLSGRLVRKTGVREEFDRFSEGRGVTRVLTEREQF
jgi:hypothetical protein